VYKRKVIDYSKMNNNQKHFQESIFCD